MAILIDRHKHKLIRTFYRNKWKKFNLKKYSRKNVYEFMIFHFILCRVLLTRDVFGFVVIYLVIN